MDSEVWGPHGWIFLHSITMTYPKIPNEIDKQRYKNFFVNLQNLLPCEKCKEHYKQNLISTPIDNHLDCRKSLVEWLIEIHNKVNESLGKKRLSFDEVMTYYNNLYYGDGNKPTFLEKHREWFSLRRISIVLLILFIILFIIVRYRKNIQNYLNSIVKNSKKPKYF